MQNKFRFADFLNWDALVASGVVACKDGSLIAGWSVEGMDLESAPDERIDAEFGRISAGISGFDDADAFWVTLSREPYNPVEGTALSEENAVLKVIELDRRDALSQVGQIYRNSLYLFYQYQPDQKSLSTDEVMERFIERCRAVEGRLGRSLNLTRLGRDVDTVEDRRVGFDQLASQLASLLGGRSRRIRHSKKNPTVALDHLLGVDWRQTTPIDLPIVDRRPLAVVAIEGFPTEFPRGALHALEEVGITFTWTSRYLAQSRRTTRKRAKWFRRQWQQSAADLAANMANTEGNRDHYADHMAREVDQAIYDTGSGAVGYGAFVSCINIWGDVGSDAKSVMRVAEDVEGILLDAGFEARIELENATEAFLGALPGHRKRNPRQVMLTSSTLVEMLPLRTIWRGDRYCPSPKFPSKSPPLLIGRARTGEEFYFNLHNQDLGHTFLFGPSGAGKSVLLGLIAAQWTKYNGRVIAFDKGRSMQYLTHALQGSHMAFGGADAQGVNPLRHAKTLGAAWTTEWLLNALRSKDATITPTVKLEVTQGVSTLLQKSDELTFMQMSQMVSDKITRDIFKQLASDPVLNSLEDHLKWSDFTTFEMDELFGDQSEANVNLILDYLFAMVRKQWDGRPTLMVIDEAWRFLNHPRFGPKLSEWLKEARKYNVAVILATQSLSDVKNAATTNALFSMDNIATRIFLPNPSAKVEDGALPQYVALGMSNRQIDLIASLTPKRDYYIVQAMGERVVDFMIRPASLSIVGQTSSDDARRAAEAFKEHPDFWVSEMFSHIERDDRAQQAEEPDL